jgi:DNA-binding winged helix-turn-helix (wHTH) protein
MQPQKERSEFASWKINLSHYSLINKHGDEIFVEPRLLKLLSLLSTNANKVVKRRELVDQVWENVVVTDESLSKAIFDLRKFLHETFEDAPQILTIRKVGYKLESKIPATPSQNYRFLRLTAKLFIYFLIAALMFVLIVRAVRYEN